MPQPELFSEIVAILRGVSPDEILDVAAVLVDEGVGAIEVPLNSPDPLKSIEKLCAAYGDRVLCGAGTVLKVADVDAVAAVGGKLIVSPNVDLEVIARAAALGLEVLPGFATATEGFAALKAGATGLKLFPAGTYGPGHIKALRDVLPKTTPVYAVGGVGAENLAPWVEAGVAGVGVGGSLYKPGKSLETIRSDAKSLVTAWRSLKNAQ